MKYEELIKQLDSQGIRRKWIAGKTIATVQEWILDDKLTLNWMGALEPVHYPLILSQEYKDLCKKLNATKLSSADCCFKTEVVDEKEVVVAYPNLETLNHWQYVSAEYIQKNGYSTVGTFFLYQDQVVIPNYSKIPYYYQNNCECEELVTTYNDNLIFLSWENLCIVDTEGNVSRICYSPKYNSESNRYKIELKENVITVSSYVYYDNDHHHGGWELETYDLKELLAA